MLVVIVFFRFFVGYNEKKLVGGMTTVTNRDLVEGIGGGGAIY